MTSQQRARGPPRALALRQAWRELQAIPNVGPATATDLVRLGILDREALAQADPDLLYARLGVLTGKRQDPCVRDILEAAVAFARDGVARPWWTFSQARKAQE